MAVSILLDSGHAAGKIYVTVWHTHMTLRRPCFYEPFFAGPHAAHALTLQLWADGVRLPYLTSL